MKKALKIILGVAGGWLLLNGVSLMSVWVSGITLSEYFPKETVHLYNDTQKFIKDKSVPEGDKMILRLMSGGIIVQKSK